MLPTLHRSLGHIRTTTTTTTTISSQVRANFRFRKMSSYTRLIRFISPSSPTPLIGEPVDANLDVGIASYESRPIEVELFSGRSVVSPGERTGKREVVERLLSPLSQEEVGTVRCIGLNVSDESIRLERDLMSRDKMVNTIQCVLSCTNPACKT